MLGSLYPILLWTDVPNCFFAESLDHREVQCVTPLPWPGLASSSLRGFQPGDRLPETKSRLCSAPRGGPGHRLQLTSLRSAGGRRSTRQVSGHGSWMECVSSAEKRPGAREAPRRGCSASSISAGDVTMDAGNMLPMKLRRALASQGRDTGPPEALAAPGTLSSVFPFRVSADRLDVPATPPPRLGLVLEVTPVRAAESRAAGRGRLARPQWPFPCISGWGWAGPLLQRPGGRLQPSRGRLGPALRGALLL